MSSISGCRTSFQGIAHRGTWEAEPQNTEAPERSPALDSSGVEVWDLVVRAKGLRERERERARGS